MRKSKFKTDAARKFTEEWVDSFIDQSSLIYEKLDVETSFGKTRILCVDHEKKDLKPIMFVPGARTCGMFWDINDNLKILGNKYRIYLVDVVGQPGLSDGNCPNLKDESYGNWLNEVCEGIGFDRGAFVGASFGGLLIFKLSGVAPEKIEKAVLMNPIGLSNISFHPKSMFNTLLPVFFPSRKNVDKFLKTIVFSETEHPDDERFSRLADYVENSIKGFQFKGEYPSKLNDGEIVKLVAETHLLVGDSDGLIPYKNTIGRGERLLRNLKSVDVFKNVGHGIEVSEKAIVRLKEILEN